MPDPEVIDGEVAEEMTQALTRYDAPPPNLFRTEDPVEIVKRATAIADSLSEVLRKKKLTTKIGKGEHVRVEGWTLLGTMLGVFPVCEWTRPLETGWEARVVAKTMAGVVVGAAEAECLRSEARWREADDYAVRSMAQTRATSKALRQPLGFVISLAGFEATPAEEMTFAEERKEPSQVFAPKSWKKLEEHFRAYGEQTWMDWVVFGGQAQSYLFPEVKKEDLTKEQKDVLWTANLVAGHDLLLVVGPGDFPPPSREQMREAWRLALEMEEDLEGPPWRMGPGEDERPELEVKA